MQKLPRQAMLHLPPGPRRHLFRLTRRHRYDFIRRKMLAESSGHAFGEFWQRGLLFIHVPKVAGVSIHETLFASSHSGHTPLWHFEAALGQRHLASLRTFAFVRNPWDRMASAFDFLKRGGINEGDAQWARQHLSNCESLEQFVEDLLTPEMAWRWKHFRPQYFFLTRTGRNIDVDFLGRYETLNEDFNRLIREFGIEDCRELAWANASKGARVSYRDRYTSRMRDIVAEVYRQDIELLGYEF